MGKIGTAAPGAATDRFDRFETTASSLSIRFQKQLSKFGPNLLVGRAFNARSHDHHVIPGGGQGGCFGSKKVPNDSFPSISNHGSARFPRYHDS
jgi:hypothetical protein